ncbi:MAG: DNA polymerase III subunit chi [Deltaproteobacteria bacterium]|nr:MAG: DNA polymerase III subunit chi [Deltaproteobacteria bacterium]
MPKAYFCRLERKEKALHLCRLAEEWYQRGTRVLVLVADENQAVTLDRFMWTWKKGSFIPHACDCDTVECHDEPVVISWRERNINNATVVILGKPVAIGFLKGFDTVIDFAETWDDEALKHSRARFKRYREAGFEPEMLE